MLSGVLCLVSVRCGSSTCMPSVQMSVVAGVVLFVHVVCVLSLTCYYICIDWTVVRIDRRGSMNPYIIWRRVGVNLHRLECTSHNRGKVRVPINGLMCAYVIWVCCTPQYEPIERKN